MALLFVDGCSHYSTAANLAEKWGMSATSVTIGNTNPRRSGTKHMCLGTYDGPTFSLSSPKATLVVGLAFNMNGFSYASYPFIIFERAGNFATVCVQLEPNGSITVRRGWNPGTILAQTDPDIVTGNAW
jgi:hypothetical protein